MEIYLLLDEKNIVDGWSSMKTSPTDVKVELSEDDDFFKSRPRIYTFSDGQLIKSEELTLRKAKENKGRDLSALCEISILGRFPVTLNGETYYFSNDMKAQSNFEKYDRALEKGRVTKINWTAYDKDGNVVRVPLNKELFEIVYLCHLEHIESNISRFRDELMPLVENAQSPEEVGKINWNSK